NPSPCSGAARYYKPVSKIKAARCQGSNMRDGLRAVAPPPPDGALRNIATIVIRSRSMPSLLEEKEAIRDLMYRYCFTTDREADPDKWAGLFTEDGVWDGAEFGRMQGHEALKAFMVKATSGGGAGFRHNMANMLIDGGGDTA